MSAASANQAGEGGRKKVYDCVSCLNRWHMLWAWLSLFWVGFTDLYVRLGQKDDAFVWLEKTFEARDASTLQFKVEPAFDSLRNDPRYAQLIRKIGLQP